MKLKVGQGWYKVNWKNIKSAIQINGKTRDVIEIEKGANQKFVEKLCKNNKKIKNKIENETIKRVIFVKDRIINFIMNWSIWLNR